MIDPGNCYTVNDLTNAKVIDHFFSDLFLHEFFNFHVKEVPVLANIATSCYGYPYYHQNKNDLSCGQIIFDRDVKDMNNIIDYHEKFKFYYEIYKELEKNFFPNTFLETIQLNLMFNGNFTNIHNDSNSLNDYTCLVMINPTWNNDHGGELVFYDTDDNVVDTVDYKPGRIIIFNSNCRHQPLPPKINSVCRYSITFRYIPLNVYLNNFVNKTLSYT